VAGTSTKLRNKGYYFVISFYKVVYADLQSSAREEFTIGVSTEQNIVKVSQEYIFSNISNNTEFEFFTAVVMKILSFETQMYFN
jgi:hypothetical protein